MPISIDAMITEYRTTHSDYVKSDAAIIDILEEEGKLASFSRAEIDAAKRNSVFGSGYNNSILNYGTVLERTSDKKDNSPKNSGYIMYTQNKAQSVQNGHWMAPRPLTESTPGKTNKTGQNAAKSKPYKPTRPDPVGNLELLYFMTFNGDILQDMISEPVGSIKIPKGKNFKTIEEAAEYILKKRGKACSQTDIYNLARELIILNSNGDEETLEEKTSNALKNINNGNASFLDRGKYNYQTELLKQCGFEVAPENCNAFQTIYMITENRIDSDKVYSGLSKIFDKFEKNRSKDITALKKELLNELGKYPDSIVVGQTRDLIDKLSKTAILDKDPIKIWRNSVLGDLYQYREVYRGLQNTLEEYANKKDPEQLKKTLLAKYGINIFSAEEQEMVQEMILQNFTANMASGVFEYLEDKMSELDNGNSLTYNITKKFTEFVDDVANLLGGDLYTNSDRIKYLEECSKTWKEFSSDKMDNDEFKAVFNKFWQKEYDEKLAKDFMEYCSNNLNNDIFKDKVFQEKFKALFGTDIISNIKTSLKGQKAISRVGDILLMLYGMKLIGNSAPLMRFNLKAADFYKNIGLTGKTFSTFMAMTSGSATFASYTAAERTLDNLITGQGADSERWDNLFKEALHSAAFGAFAGALQVLVTTPIMEDIQVKRASKIITNSLKSGKEVSGKDFLKIVLDAQEAVTNPNLKNKLIEGAVSVGVNGTGFTLYNIIEDLASNGLAPLKGENAGKYLGTVALENLKSLLSFEVIKMIMGMSIAGKTGEETANKTKNYDNLDKLVSLQNLTISEIKGDNGKVEYMVRYVDNKQTAKSSESVLVFNTVDDAMNFCLSRVMAELCIRYAHAQAQYAKQAQYQEQRRQNNQTQIETLKMIEAGEITPNAGENLPVKPAPIPPDVAPSNAPAAPVVDIPQVPVQPTSPELPVNEGGEGVPEIVASDIETPEIISASDVGTADQPVTQPEELTPDLENQSVTQVIKDVISVDEARSVVEKIFADDANVGSEEINTILKVFDNDGKIAPEAIELIQLIKDNCFATWLKPVDYVQMIIDKAFVPEPDKPVTAEEINNVIDFINTLKNNGFITPDSKKNIYNHVSKAIDSNGIFRPKEYLRMLKEGYGEDLIDRIMYNANMLEEHFDAVTELAKLQYENGNYILGKYSVGNLSEVYEKYPDAVKILLQKGLNAAEIKDLAEVYTMSPAKVEELLEVKDENDARIYHSGEIQRIIHSYNAFANGTDKLLKMQTSNQTPRFNSYGIEELAETCEDYPDAVEALAKLEGIDGKPRFKAYDIKQLAPLYDSYPQQVQALINLTAQEGRPRLSAYEIESLITDKDSRYLQYPQAAIELLGFVKQDGKPCLDLYDVKNLMESYHNSKQETEYFLNIRNDDGSMRFSASYIPKLIIVRRQYPAAVDELIELKDENGTPRLTDADIIYLAPIYENNKDEIQKKN